MIDKKQTEDRLEAITKLVGTRSISSQHELIKMLKSEYNIDTTQAGISRDFRRLGISKRDVKGNMIYQMPEVDTTKEILRLAITGVAHNESLIVIKTLAGLAAFVGDFLDLHECDGILGTLAGENMVFVTPISTKEIKKTYKKVKALVGFEE